jgi:hypothetical protein
VHATAIKFPKNKITPLYESSPGQVGLYIFSLLYLFITVLFTDPGPGYSAELTETHLAYLLEI